MNEDIHGYRRRYEHALKLLRSSNISDKNKQLIEKFCNDCISEGITAGRVQKYAYILRRIAEWLEKDFDAANEDEERILRQVRSYNRSSQKNRTQENKTCFIRTVSGGVNKRAPVP